MPPEVLLRFWTGQHPSRRDSDLNAPAIKVAEFEASASPKNDGIRRIQIVLPGDPDQREQA